MTTLRPANENPWYVLMTLHGEQEGEFDGKLHEMNRLTWNSWALSVLPEELRKQTLANAPTLSLTTSFWAGSRNILVGAIKAQLKERNAVAPPFIDVFSAGHQLIDIKGVRFLKPLCLDGFILPWNFFLSDSKFDRKMSARDAIFLGDSDFANCEFQDHFSLARAKVHGWARLDGIVAEKGAAITGCSILGTTLLRGSTFHDCLLAGECLFEGPIYAEGLHIEDSAFLNNSVFKSISIFDGAKLERA